MVDQIPKVKNGMSKGLACRLSVKALAGLAVGAVLLTSTTLISTPSYANTLERLPWIGVIEEFGGVPSDAWRFDAPFYDDFRSEHATRAYPGATMDFTAEPYLFVEEYEWGDLVDAPVNDDVGYGPLAYLDVMQDAQSRIDYLLAESNAADVEPLPGDAWRFDAPYYDDFRVDDKPADTDAGSALNQEIQRLEYKVGVLLSAAQDPGANPQQIDREIRSLDHQIDALITVDMLE